MDPVRPLRSVLDDLVGAGEAAADAEQALGAAGHGELPPDLVTEAMVSFAAVAPPALAEQLAPFVTAQSAAALDGGPAGADPADADPAWGLELIAAASPVDPLDELVDPGALDDAAAVPDASPVLPAATELPAHQNVDQDVDQDDDLDFGGGTDQSSPTEPSRVADLPIDDLPIEDLPAGLDLDPGVVLDAGLDDGLALDGLDGGPPAGPVEAPVDEGWDDGLDGEAPEDVPPPA